MRYNLGGGDIEIAGFFNVDRKFGMEVFPLLCADDSLDEIRASHVLEHFPYRVVPDVLKHWVAKLRPGGLLRVAVPDFLWVVNRYLLGDPDVPVQGYIMGGQSDPNDFHMAIFDECSLHYHMTNAGLVVDEGRWTSEVDDCARLPVSLNLQGRKPCPG